MAVNNYFSHTDSLGRDPFTRMAAFGYSYNTWKGENLAAGTADPQEALQLWQNSPAHNANLLNPHYVVVGLALVYREGSTYGNYWSADFGGQSEVAAPAPTPQPPAPAPQPTPQPASTCSSAYA